MSQTYPIYNARVSLAERSSAALSRFPAAFFRAIAFLPLKPCRHKQMYSDNPIT